MNNQRAGWRVEQFPLPALYEVDLRSEVRVALKPLGSAVLALVLCAFAIAAIAGCSSGSAKQTNSQTPLITVSISQAPPVSMNVASTVQVTATLANDPANAGIDWYATCSSAGSCGTVSPAHTASGGTTTYTAPSLVPSKNTVNVTASATTDHSKYSLSTVTILSTVTSLSITQPPPTTVPAGAILSLGLAGGTNAPGTIPVSAAVVGDPSNSGVTWSFNCGGISCGGAESVPGSGTNFQVPGPASNPPVAIGTLVVLTAKATADHNFSDTTSFTVGPQISISFTQLPPQTLPTNGTAIISATVASDPTNQGVTWSVSCSASPCGSFSSTTSASGAPVTFTAPPTASPVNGSNPAGFTTIVAIATASSFGGIPTRVSANLIVIAPPAVSLSETVPTNSLSINQSAPLIATVTNDPSSAGVDWSVTCSAGAGNCGSFSPAHTASGTATSYTAPGTVPTGGTVTITAASTAQPSQTSPSYTVTITSGVPPNKLLLGQFVLLLTSKNSSNGPYGLGGYITGDGNGNITSGTLDAAAPNSGGGPASASGTYSIGGDGRGQIQLTASASVGVGGSGMITLGVVFVNPQHALITETDGSATASGTLDQQMGGYHGLSGNYALQLTRFASAGPNDFVASAISIGTGSYTYVTDRSNNGSVSSIQAASVSGGIPVSIGPAFGSYQISSLDLGLGAPFTSVDVWVIDANHFVVTDWRDFPNFIGHMTTQPSSAALSGAYAFTVSGATSTGAPQAAGGVLTCGSTGTLDVVPLGGTPLINESVNATCSALLNGRGTITVSPTTGGVSKFAAYPTLDQGTYLVELDAIGTSGPSGAGIAVPQTSTPPLLNSAYAGLLASNTTPGAQFFSGQILADGTATINGTLDVNSYTTSTSTASPSTGATLNGSYSSIVNGRFPLMLNITPAGTNPPVQVTPVNAACYIVNANSCLLLDLDARAPGTGVLELQSLGL